MEIKVVGDRRFLLLSWDDVEKFVDRVDALIAADSYGVDTIVGVLRGGMVVANLLSDLLGVREIYVVGCKSYTDTRREELMVYHDLELRDLSKRNILLVDDVADTGSTLEVAVNRVLKPRKPNAVKTATLLVKPWSRVKPDYVAESTDAWIVFPWERMETVKAVAKLFVEKYGVSGAVKELTAISRLGEDTVASLVKD
ncbi:MAG: phosphoribosyltransferase [Candidatus Caldarchaeum sp.]|nr:phosphoribosyltransferase [Candidatus Caldarchaeum sp.]MCS7137387.1 phosphoribosyltransferase [Candidatus Caldarchaeum sp.]MDW7978853.1 phosphoribosyltransferase [Candidatus Caldarchaeum sp.]MDW8359238.1 phosphoribosyltransferase [Candidatus Caldarchaeum sp.]